MIASSPRTWGCFRKRYPLLCTEPVFPTHVGVFLNILGDFFQQLQSSPRTWGCFLDVVKVRRIIRVFPTHVGVFPTGQKGIAYIRVFPTHVGVFPGKLYPPDDREGLPHARGGVSDLR